MVAVFSLLTAARTALSLVSTLDLTSAGSCACGWVGGTWRGGGCLQRHVATAIHENVCDASHGKPPVLIGCQRCRLICQLCRLSAKLKGSQNVDVCLENGGQGAPLGRDPLRVTGEGGNLSG